MHPFTISGWQSHPFISNYLSHLSSKQGWQCHPFVTPLYINLLFSLSTVEKKQDNLFFVTWHVFFKTTVGNVTALHWTIWHVFHCTKNGGRRKIMLKYSVHVCYATPGSKSRRRPCSHVSGVYKFNAIGRQ